MLLLLPLLLPLLPLLPLLVPLLVLMRCPPECVCVCVCVWCGTLRYMLCRWGDGGRIQINTKCITRMEWLSHIHYMC